MSGGIETPTGSCGWEALPCVLIHSALDHCGAQISTITLSSDTIHTQEVSLSSFTGNSRSFAVQQNSSGTVRPTKLVSAPTTDSSFSQGIFASSAKSLTFTHIAFTLTSTHPLNRPLVSATSGTLSLLSLSISPEETSSSSSSFETSASLIRVQQSSIIIQGSTFTDFTFTSGSGTVVYATIGSSGTLSLSGMDETPTQFTNCIAGTNGGAVYISTTSTSLTPSPPIQMKATTF